MAKQATVPPAFAQSLNKEIVNAANAGDGDYELRLLRAQVDMDPRNLKARLELAERYRSLGFTEVAVEHCRLACERAPDSDDAHIALAQILRSAGRSKEAAAVLTAYTSGHADAGRVWAWLGLVFDDTEDWKAGEAAHRKALAIDPLRDEFHNNLGYCLLRQGRHEDAAAEFRAALKLQPHSAIAENNLALALAALTGKTGEAVTHMQSVADPATAHNNMAVALIESGRYPEARQEIAEALRYNRAHSAALNNLRLLSELEGRPAEMPVRAESRWSRAAAAWHRFWGVSVPDKQDGKKTDDSGSPVASR